MPKLKLWTRSVGTDGRTAGRLALIMWSDLCRLGVLDKFYMLGTPRGSYLREYYQPLDMEDS